VLFLSTSGVYAITVSSVCHLLINLYERCRDMGA
jgi:hypothetical protein